MSIVPETLSHQLKEIREQSEFPNIQPSDVLKIWYTVRKVLSNQACMDAQQHLRLQKQGCLMRQ